MGVDSRALDACRAHFGVVMRRHVNPRAYLTSLTASVAGTIAATPPTLWLRFLTGAG